MPLTSREKHIVNPYASQVLADGGLGNYEYSNERNRFVIDAIHHYYLQIGTFPESGTRLRISGEPFTAENNTITSTDLLAYNALYPQTSVYDAGTASLQLATENQISEAFRTLIQRLGNKIDRYTTDSTEGVLESGFEDLSQEEQQRRRLVAIPSIQSQEYINNLNQALNIPEPITGEGVLSQLDTTMSSRYVAATDPNVDLYDWKNNCLPGTQQQKTYYNSNNDTLVYTIRTGDTEYDKYDIGYLMVEQDWWLEQLDDWIRERVEEGDPLPSSDSIVQNYMTIIIKGLQEILKFAGKSSRSNLQSLLGPALEEESSRALRLLVALGSPLARMIAEEERGWFDGLTRENEAALDEDSIRYRVSAHLDSRPGSRWIFRVYIDRRFIDELPGGSLVAPSYEEDELSPLQRALIILDDDQNNPTKKKFYSVDQTYRYVSSTVQLLRDYDRQMLEEGIGPAYVNNLDVGFEASKISNFSDYLGLFYSYNKLNIDVDDDRIEFFMNDDYSLRYMCVNGNLYTRGLGNATFYPNASADERILNAFSLYTGTTFSYMFYLRELYETYQSNSRNSLPPWGEVLPRYTYPPLDLRAGQLERITSDAVIQKIQQKKKNIFQTISEITQTSISPEELEVLFSKRKRKYAVKTLLNPALTNCRTGQSKAVQLGLNVYAEMLGKKRYRKIARETIMFLRDEIFNDTVKNYRMGGPVIGASINQALNFSIDATQAYDRPDLFTRQIEAAINQQISCALSLGANNLESAFLDPIGAPPEVKDLVRRGGHGAANQLKVKFKNPFGSSGALLPSEAQRKAWRWAVDKILENFIKSILVGIVRDIIEASLGCGPKHLNRKTALQQYSETLRNSFALENYGFSNLNNYTEGVDYYSAALQSQLILSSVPNSDATHTGLTQFVQDVSLMTTPEELQFLLEGDANDDLIDLIVETTTRGKVVVRNRNTSTVAQGQVTGEQEIDPSLYRMLNITDSTIVDFFLEVGNRMYSKDIPAIELQSPLEAYCDLKNPEDQPLQFILSNDQLAAQYVVAAQEKMKMINTLCDLLSSSQNLEAQIGAMVASLPRFDSYNNFLSLISQASNDFWQWLVKQLNWIDDPEGAASPVQNIYSTQIGAELYWTTGRLQQVVGGIPQFSTLYDPQGSDITPEYTEIPANQEYGSRYHWTIPGRGGGAAPPGQTLPLPYSPPGQEFSSQERKAFYRSRTAPGTLRSKFNMYKVGFDEEVTANFNRACAAQISIQNSWYPAYGFVNPIIMIPYPSEAGGIKAFKSLPDNWLHGSYSNAALLTAENNIVPTYRQPSPEFLASYNFRTPGSASQEPYINAIDYNIYQEMFNSQGNLLDRYNPIQQNIEQSMFNPSLIPLEHSSDAWQALLMRASSGVYYNASWYNDENHGDERPYPWPEGIDGPSSTDGSSKVLFYNDPPYNPNLGGVLGQGVSVADTGYVGSKSVFNGGEVVEEHLTSYLATSKGNRRFQRIAAVMTTNPLKKLPLDCPNFKKEAQANALRLSIQQRVQEFMFNVCPLFRVYPDFKNLGTIKLFCDYLTRKCIREWTENQSLGSAYEAIESFEYIYGVIAIDPNLEYDEYGAKIFGIIERLLVGEDLKLEYLTPQQAESDNRERGFLQMLNIKSIFDWRPENPSTSGLRYKNFLISFYMSLLDQISQRAQGIIDNYQLSRQSRLRVASTLTNRLLNVDGSARRNNYINFNLQPEGLTYGTYYYPVALQIASAYLYYAEGVKYINRFTETSAKQNALKASFDKSLVFSIKGVDIPYRRDLLEYPIEVPTAIRAKENYKSFAAVYGNESLDRLMLGRTISYIAGGGSFEQTRIYYNRQQVTERRDQLINSIIEEVGFVFEAGIGSRADRIGIIRSAPLLQYMDKNEYASLLTDLSDRASWRNYQGRIVRPDNPELHNPVYILLMDRFIEMSSEIRRNVGDYLDDRNARLFISELNRWKSDIDAEHNQDVADDIDLNGPSSRSQAAKATGQMKDILNWILVIAGFSSVLQEINYLDEQLSNDIPQNVTVI